MADPNLYQLMFDDEPTAQEHATALAAVLRAREQQNQARDALASIASMGQNPLLQGFAKGQLARVGQDQTDIRDQQGQLLQAGERRLQRQVEAKRFGDQQSLEQTMLTQRLAAEAREGAASRANQLLMERERMAAELLREQGKAAKEKEAKPVPEQEAVKVINQANALPQIDKLQALHDQVGLITGTLGKLGIHVGPEGRYNDAVNALAGPIAAGALPAARETPGLMEEFRKNFPSGVLSNDRAKAYFDAMRDATKTNAEGQIAVLKSGNYNPAQVQELTSRVGGIGGGAAPSKQVVRKQVNRAIKQTRLTYSDGTSEVVDGIQ